MDQQATPESRFGLGDQARPSQPVAASSPSPSETPPTGQASPSPADAGLNGPFGAQLEPVLRQQCGDRLSAISWFRTDWQRGGALTGYATWAGGDAAPRDVMVKMPVPPRERLWLQRLQDADDAEPVVPRLYAQGEALGGYDLAWVVMERLPHGPLGSAWGGEAFGLAIDAAARFHRATDRHEPSGPPLQYDWDDMLKKARAHIASQSFPDAPRWKAALKKAAKKLKKWRSAWDERPITGWVHGDLHLGNAMTRCDPPGGPAVLFDLAHVRPGHWVEDAVYFEHLYWSHTELLGGHRIGAELAKARKAQGLAVDADWPRLAQVKRALFAMTTPVLIHHDGGHQHIHAALEVLEREVG